MTGLHGSTAGMTGASRPRPFPALPIVLALASAATVPARAGTVVTDGVPPRDLSADCHDLDGVSAMARLPTRAGRPPADIVRQVRDFAAGHRTNAGGRMAVIPSDIADAELARMAAYFSSRLPPPPQPSLATDTEQRRYSTRLYQRGDPAAGTPPYRAFHDSDVTGQPKRPLLTAQHAAYVANQLHDWRTGPPANDAAVIATVQAPDQDIAALIACLASASRMPAAPGGPQ